MTGFNFMGLSFRWYNHLYAVSRCGKVLRKGRPFLPRLRKDGYVECGRPSGNKSALLHRMVAACWLADFCPAKQVHHKDENRQNNHVDNLECLFQKEHLTDRHADVMHRFAFYERTPEIREKLRQARVGSVTSDETKAKQSAALKGRKRPYFARAAHSLESRQNRSLTHPKNLSCRINGVEYRSFAEASRATGIKRGTIRLRCFSENFPDYQVAIK